MQFGAEDAGAGGRAVRVGSRSRARRERHRSHVGGARTRRSPNGRARRVQSGWTEAERTAARTLGPRAATRAATDRKRREGHSQLDLDGVRSEGSFS